MVAGTLRVPSLLRPRHTECACYTGVPSLLWPRHTECACYTGVPSLLRPRHTEFACYTGVPSLLWPRHTEFACYTGNDHSVMGGVETMFSLLDWPTRLCDGISRRELLRIGGVGFLGATGLSLANVLEAQAQASSAAARDRAFGRAKNVIYLWLQGGPPQHETWDPKPDAPAEIRGAFRPVRTNVPGMHFCELLPRTAALADKLAVVRSLATNNHIHSASGYHVLTGYRYQGSNARQISPNDWPYLGSVVRQLKPSEAMPAYTTVWLPDVMRLNENVQPAGQTAGFMGRRWDPERIIWDPASAEAQIQQFALRGEIPPTRLTNRRRLLSQIDRHFRHIERNGTLDTHDQYVQEAFSLLGSGRARQAFDISQEPDRLRDRYGRTRWGQCVLLARRLIEAGVRLVHVNWPREEGDSAVDNPLWDTHALNADRLQDVLCPQFDISFSALIEDLDQRGLLEETLVVVIAEFGRTPRINRVAGRDHWGNVFSFAMAGAGIRSAQVYGASDRIGGYPRENPVAPEDVTATIFHLLGIDHSAAFRDPTNRPFHITRGTPLHTILGTEPATRERCQPEGDLNLVPPPSEEKLFNTDFEDGVPLITAGSASRVRGWQADPIVANQTGCGVRILENTTTAPGVGRHQTALGLWSGTNPFEIRHGQRLLLAQEIRNARAGHYRFTVQACGQGTSRRDFEELFARHFTCKLMLLRYGNRDKDPRNVQELASLSFAPTFQEGNNARFQSVQLSQLLDSPRPGVNFPIGLGLGVAVIVEKTSPGVLRLGGGNGRSAFLSLDRAELVFGGRQINEDVQV